METGSVKGAERRIMNLKKLSLKNFKGIQSFDLEIKGDSVDIFGDNATGKTTLFDAFTWLLFGKDSRNSADFDIKTLDPSGESAHGLEHTVEAVLGFKDSDMILKKVYVEKWTKKRGAAHREFTGHTINHFIDDVPAKQKEYGEAINAICDETVFKLLTNPRHFNEVLHWQDRRKLLLEVCGDISDEDVIGSDKSLAELPEILKNRKLEDHRKVIMAKRTEINKELDKIPVRIDEAKNGYHLEVRGIDTVKTGLASAEENKKDAIITLNEIKTGGESAVLTTKLREVENRVNEIDNAIASEGIKTATERAAERLNLKNEIDVIGGDIAIVSRKKEDLGYSKDLLEKQIKELEKDVDELRDRWHKEDAAVFKVEQSSVCPSCGQSLPEEKLKAAREKALSDFNEAKAKALTDITEDGKMKRRGLDEFNANLSKLPEVLKGVEGDIKARLDKKAEAEDVLKRFDDQAEAQAPDNPERISLIKEKEKIEKQILDKKDTVDQSAIKDGEAFVEAIERQIESWQKELLYIEANARIDVRIKELTDQERKLSAEYEDLERQLNLADKFIRTKVKLLEEKINAKFQLARWKLFEDQINEGLRECCTATSNGVPYASMNNGARINIGLDICNTLSEHFGKSLPCFIDNAEAVSELLPTEAQQIRLLVSSNDKTLKVKGG